MKIETKLIQAGYNPKNGDPRVLPIYQSTTYAYDSSAHLGDLFDLKAEGHIYSRISNPTLAFVEEKLAKAEGGVGAMLTSSGQSATLLAILNICSSGDHILSSNSIYGGTINLLSHTLKKFGIEVTYINQDDDISKLEKHIRPNTKLIFAETISNPALTVLDIEKFAKFASKNNLPLFVDNTFATPYLCRPFEHGADVVIHSTSKYLDGHATVLGGAIVDSGKFDWTKFSEFTTKDESYHGIIYAKDFKDAPFITKARVQLMRDAGAMMSPLSAFLLNLGIETLHVRMQRHCENALQVAKYLDNHKKIVKVNYPNLKNNAYYDLCKKYCPEGGSGVISFLLDGKKDDCIKFMDKLKLAKIVVHVADLRTCVLHPASTTHRQLSESQLIDAGIQPNLIRFSVGLENVLDIIEDLEQALDF